MNNEAPYLSVVAVSRNDDHGGDPLIRTQLFIDNLAFQCEKLNLPTEIIVVDWNPVGGRPGLSKVLSLPKNLQYISSRVITVPHDLHKKFKCADKLGLFQMIGKNVGIRRAKGEFILATNIDILFSDELMNFLSHQTLRGDRVYRVDRFDINSGIPQNKNHDEVLNYAWNNRVRESIRLEPAQLVDLYKEKKRFNREIVLDYEAFQGVPGISVLNVDGCWQILPNKDADVGFLHTNACGDFTLMSKKAWNHIGGYAEFEGYSFNIDSLAVIAAHYSGIQEVTLLPPYVCFHIEHGIGSGWTPEGEDLLFSRLCKNGVVSPEWPVLMPLVDKMKADGECIQFNESNWGLCNFDLPEAAFGDDCSDEFQKLSNIYLSKENLRVTSIKPQYDLDRLTLIYERKHSRKGSKGNGMNGEMQLYLPDATGSYSEENSVKRIIPVGFAGNIIFEIESLNNYALRLDPLNIRGMINVNSLIVMDPATGTMLLNVAGKKLSKLFDCAKDALLMQHFESVVFNCLSHDPQVIMRLEKYSQYEKLTLILNVDFPEFISS